MTKVVQRTTLTGARDYFAGELRSVMERQHLEVNAQSVDYVADLLVRHMDSGVFFAKSANGKLENNVLANLYGEYLAGNVEKKRLVLRRLGDICLLISGFFSDSLKRKLVDVDYYLGMGGTAYGTLAHSSPNGVKSVYEELSRKIKPVSDALSEMSERSGLNSNSDLLRLYERWLFTGNDRLKSILSEHGITPVAIETKMRH